MRRAGFTIIELIVAIVVLGILLAAAIPNFINMQIRAKEAGVRSNAHTVQLVAADFSVESNGVNAVDPAEDRGFGTMVDLLPQGQLLSNPFTMNQDSPVVGVAANRGEIGYQGNDANGDGAMDGYRISGHGDEVVIVRLTGDFQPGAMVSVDRRVLSNS